MDLIEAQGSKRGTSCTAILIRDMCRLCVTVKEFGWYLKKIENFEALEALGWPNGRSTVYTICIFLPNIINLMQLWERKLWV